MARPLLLFLTLSPILVAQTPTTVTLAGLPNPSVYGAAVTVTATITPPTATGIVTFYDGENVLGVSPVSTGQAAFTTHLLNTGAHALHAHYSGDSTYTASDSASALQTVNATPAKSFQAAALVNSLPVNAIAAGDFNLDGNTDLVIGDYFANSLLILLGNGNGTFQLPIAYTLPSVARVAVGDMNGDGIPDLVTDSGSGITLWIGKGDGSFTQGNSYEVFPPELVQIADFNGDGKADVLVAASFNLQVWLGNGDGTLVPQAIQTLPGNGSPAFAIGDFNGDGKADVASMGYTAAASSFVVLMGNGDGTFYAALNPANASANGNMIGAADLNNDGKLDLVLATNSSTVSVLLGNGDGTFQAASKYSSGVSSAGVAIADFNGDGKPDLIVVDQFENQLSVLAGKGDGTFGSPANFAIGASPAGIALGDFNGDGRVDAAVSTQAGAEVLLGQAAATATLAAVSVSPGSGSGAAQTFSFQFTDSTYATDIATMQVMFAPSLGNLSGACVITYTRSSNSFSLLSNGGTQGNWFAVAGPPGSVLQNSQCALDAAQSNANVYGSSTQLLSVQVAFFASFAGTQNIYALATSAEGAATGWQRLGSWTATAAATAPQPVLVSPSNGAGTAATFTFTFADPNGRADLDSAGALIGSSTAAASSCLITVQPAASRVWLANDAGNGWVGSNALGTSGTLANSQCSLSGSSSTESWSGNTLTLTLSLTFAAGYSGGKNIYGSAASLTGLGGSWVNLGTWTVGTPAPPPSFLISTLAGLNLPPTAMPATSAVLPSPEFVATDRAGNLYFTDSMFAIVFRVDPNGQMTRVAGNGSAGFSGDGGPALNSQLGGLSGVAVDAAGNLYIADFGNSRVRRVSPAGIITTFAGNGSCCTASGDGGSATRAALPGPHNLAIDSAGNLFIADEYSRTVRRVDTSGIISTVAGNGTTGYSPDGTLATQASLGFVGGLAVDASGSLIMADDNNNVVRRITGGALTTIAGNRTGGYSGDGGPATAAELFQPYGLALDTGGDLFIIDQANGRIRMVTPAGVISTVAGDGGSGLGGIGDGGPALQASMYDPNGLAVDPSGTLYIADTANRRIRKVAGGIISTFAGGASGDAPAAPQESFASPAGLARDSSGNLYVSDTNTSLVHVIAPSGATSVIAGSGVAGYAGDHGPATAAQLYYPMALAVDNSGSLYIADFDNYRIRRVSGGTISTVAGNGSGVFSGDGGPATNAGLRAPSGIAVDSAGNLYIGDYYDNRVRMVSTAGIITTVAGTGAAGFAGDGGPATAAELNGPNALAVNSAGNLYIGDQGNARVRKVNPAGIITTIAGNGQFGSAGDGGPAVQASTLPQGVAVDSAGNVYISDTRVRVVTTQGIIYTVAGTGSTGPPGDGGPALNGTFGEPSEAAADNAGNLYVLDPGYRAIRLLTPQQTAPLVTVSSSHNSASLGAAAEYTLNVTNAALAGPSSGTVSVTEYLPAGLDVSSMSGNGWNCSGAICTRGDALAPGVSYPIAVTVDVPLNAPSQATNQVTVSGGGSPLLGAQDFTIFSAQTVTIQTSPSALQFSLDNQSPQTAPQTVSVAPGTHLLTVPSPQPGGPGTQYVFESWSDSGTQTHQIDITAATSTAYTAQFQAQYQVSTSVAPAAAGSVTPASCFLEPGTVTLSATSVPPFVFSYWSGGISTTANPTSLTVTAPISVAANFVSLDVNQDGKVDINDVQQILNELLGNLPPHDDFDHDGIVSVTDLERLLIAVLGG